MVAVPTPPGVQTTGVETLSHVPAQTRPLLAMLTTLGLLLRYAKVAFSGLFVPLRAVAENCVVLPSSTETLGAGESLMTAGTPNPGVGGTLLLQPKNTAIAPVITIAANLNPNLPMHPPRAARAGEIVFIHIASSGTFQSRG